MADRLFMYNWYHGNIGRSTSESILMQKKPGIFLLRASSTMPGGYVLSVSENNRVSHYIITCQEGRYTIGDQTFNDLPEIVDFYKRHFLDTTTLQEAAARQISGEAASEPEQAPPRPHASEPVEDALPKVKAKYNFPGNDPEDLPFKKNDVLYILKKEEAQWWMARDATGKEGMIPANYVEQLGAATLPKPVQPIRPTQSAGPPNRVSAPSQGYTGLQNQESASQALAFPAIFEAIQDRTPTIYDPLELKFTKGTQILVNQPSDSGTLEGKLLSGKTGHFPLRFVKIITSDPKQVQEFSDQIANL